MHTKQLAKTMQDRVNNNSVPRLIMSYLPDILLVFVFVFVYPPYPFASADHMLCVWVNLRFYI